MLHFKMPYINQNEKHELILKSGQYGLEIILEIKVT